MTKTSLNDALQRKLKPTRKRMEITAGTRSYVKSGALRKPRLMVASLSNTHDPAANDPSITGKSSRVLTQDELQAILPFLECPSPKIGDLEIESEFDYRPIAIRFILLTAARREEVCSMRWRDVDRRNAVWHKPKVKATKGGPRSQYLPLSGAAMDLL